MRTRSSVGILTALLLAGCDATGPASAPRFDASEREVTPEGTQLAAIFEAAAKEYGVPVDLLQSVAWTETRWQMVSGDEELGRAPAYGIMGLRGENFEVGAKLAGVSSEEAGADVRANVRAAAALLSKTASELGIARADLADWAPVVAAYSGTESFEARQSYVHDEVYATLASGIVTEAMVLPATATFAHFPMSDKKLLPGPDYAGSVWRPSLNYNARPSGKSGKPSLVIIHTCEGSYSGCWGWLATDAANVSAHFVVNSDGSEISQLVREKDKAWHIAADYDCKLNGGVNCPLNGLNSNAFTVGIEHAGFGSQSSWDPNLIANSAKLVCAITEQWAIPRDKFHIVGHGQLQPYNRSDPGKAWPWGKYLELVNAACDGEPPPSVDPPMDPALPSLQDVIVDSNNKFNASNAECSLKGDWTASTSVTGYYQTGYWWRSVGPSNELVEFRVKLATAKKMRVFGWWPAALDRSQKAPFLVYDSKKVQLDTVYVNQQENGGQWVELGTYNFTMGWNSVGLSRFTTGGGVVVADAVRFTEVK